ncbi:hypothetical protein ACIA8O_13440 [Kitasatospora sp. NPDC051853]|uniref:hypothetical protein n=1 Tax=Kitasatospora sp. NPDC051853 TaxID=3364058 RepID=UPI0037A8FD13
MAEHDFTTPYVEQRLPDVPGADYTRTEDDQGVRVVGPCPRCQGRTETVWGHGLAGTGTKAIFRRNRSAPVDPVPEVHYCECGYPHPGMAANAPFTGCGASWEIGAAP